MRTIIDKIGNWLCGFGCDRWLHMALSVVLCVVLCVVLTPSGVGYNDITVVSALLTVSAGVVKEGYDEMTTGNFDLTDFAFDCIGVAMFVIARL